MNPRINLCVFFSVCFEREHKNLKWIFKKMDWFIFGGLQSRVTEIKPDTMIHFWAKTRQKGQSKHDTLMREKTDRPPRRVCSANVIRGRLEEEHFDTCLIFGVRRRRYHWSRKEKIVWPIFNTLLILEISIRRWDVFKFVVNLSSIIRWKLLLKEDFWCDCWNKNCV